jgi:DNA invertase Pin-like site-specific DNA recombinase
LKQSSEPLSQNNKRLCSNKLKNGFENTQVFADNGYSRVNFERPAFRRMLHLIEDGKIGVIITKDYCAIIGLNQKDLENQGILA